MHLSKRIGDLRLAGSDLTIAVAAAALIWSSWPALVQMADRWSGDPRYSHGYLVPVFAVAILALRRDRFPGRAARPSWWGLPLVALGAGMQLTGTYLYLSWLPEIALIPALAGLSVLLGGWPCLRWSAPAIGFLFFMVPLPFQLEVAMGQSLQRVACLASVYGLQTLGLAALPRGNVIRLEGHDLNVAEACSGLSMLMTFFALSAAAALLIHRPRIHQVLILVNAIPIAIAANVARILVTAVMYATVGSKWAELVFHDLAGWLMMVLALALMAAELRLLDVLLVPTAAPAPLTLGDLPFGTAGRVPGAPGPASPR